MSENLSAKASTSGAPAPELVTIQIDDRELKVPKGKNIVDAATEAGIDIPHYCYHPNLSIAGNCRMCQVEIVGQPKLGIACNTTAAEGLKIRTHHTSAAVAESQRSTLEFLLINHPLDCTVCDQAGHCKLQDYYYEYDGSGSRFIEDKVNKVKAVPLGPEVIYDGERCIMCTRCVRFCDEVTHTSELGAYNRGDKGIIGVFPGKELDNPLSGTVVDLCPVGALTHRRWRFNSRIWYSSVVDSICAGCSTGCNVSVAVRDDRIVQVKARQNSEVNKEWMCDKGRYGFENFQPAHRLSAPMVRNSENRFNDVSAEAAAKQAFAGLKGTADDAAVFISPFLTLEEMWVAAQFAEKVMGVKSNAIAVALKKRELTPVEAILVSPDIAPNGRGAELLNICSGGDGWREELQSNYEALLRRIESGGVKRALFVGDRSVVDSDVNSALLGKILSIDCAVSIGCDAVSSGGNVSAANGCKIILPGRTVNEKGGVMVNRTFIQQRIKPLLTAPFGTFAEWMWLSRIAKSGGVELVPATVGDERSLSRHLAKSIAPFSSGPFAGSGADKNSDAGTGKLGTGSSVAATITA